MMHLGHLFLLGCWVGYIRANLFSHHNKKLLYSKAIAVSNPSHNFSLVETRGAVAGACADMGFNYVFEHAPDLRTPGWDKDAVDSHRKKGTSLKLCGYGYDKSFEAYEPEKNNLVMLDVGCNMGLVTFPYWSKGWKIIAFDPIPLNIEAMKINMFINGVHADSMALIHAAVSDTTGEITIYDNPGRSDNAALSNKASNLNVGQGTAPVAIKVPSIALDDYISKARDPTLKERIAIIKIDVQGSELDVLKGLTNFLRSPPSLGGGHPFAVIAEFDVNLQRASGHGPDDMLAYMRNLGYTVHCSFTGPSIIPPTIPACPDVIFLKS